MTDQPTREESFKQSVGQAVAEIIITGFTEWREIELPEGERVTLTFTPEGSHTTEAGQELGIYKVHACATHRFNVESGMVIGLPIYEHSENEGAQENATYAICRAAALEMINCVRRQELRPRISELDERISDARKAVTAAQEKLNALAKQRAAIMAVVADIGGREEA